jgi:hypothetical protein
MRNGWQMPGQTANDAGDRRRSIGRAQVCAVPPLHFRPAIAGLTISPPGSPGGLSRSRCPAPPPPTPQLGGRACGGSCRCSARARPTCHRDTRLAEHRQSARGPWQARGSQGCTRGHQPRRLHPLRRVSDAQRAPGQARVAPPRRAELYRRLTQPSWLRLQPGRRTEAARRRQLSASALPAWSVSGEPTRWLRSLLPFPLSSPAGPRRRGG